MNEIHEDLGYLKGKMDSLHSLMKTHIEDDKYTQRRLATAEKSISNIKVVGIFTVGLAAVVTAIKQWVL